MKEGIRVVMTSNFVVLLILSFRLFLPFQDSLQSQPDPLLGEEKFDSLIVHLFCSKLASIWTLFRNAFLGLWEIFVLLFESILQTTRFCFCGPFHQSQCSWLSLDWQHKVKELLIFGTTISLSEMGFTLPDTNDCTFVKNKSIRIEWCAICMCLFDQNIKH